MFCFGSLSKLLVCLVGAWQAVLALRQGCGHVPFRQSRLTTLLRDALGGNCETVLIVCAWCEDFFLDETVTSPAWVFSSVVVLSSITISTFSKKLSKRITVYNALSEKTLYDHCGQNCSANEDC